MCLNACDRYILERICVSVILRGASALTDRSASREPALFSEWIGQVKPSFLYPGKNWYFGVIKHEMDVALDSGLMRASV